MSNILVLTNSGEPAEKILPSVSLLPHVIRVALATAAAVSGGPAADAVLVDARTDLVQVRQLFRQLRGGAAGIPVLAVVTEGGWAAVTAEWGADDLVLHTAGPGEVEARLRLAISRTAGSRMTGTGMAGSEPTGTGEVRSGELVINEATYSARMHGRVLDLTFKEFELLKFLAQHPRRVFTRSQLLQEVWGYDYFGGTRTVDVHVRRLRAKLGAENETLIGTVRNVGYRFVPVKADGPAAGTVGPAGQHAGRSARRPGWPPDPPAGGQGRAARSRQAAGAAERAGAGEHSSAAEHSSSPEHSSAAEHSSSPEHSSTRRKEASPAHADS